MAIEEVLTDHRGIFLCSQLTRQPNMSRMSFTRLEVDCSRVFLDPREAEVL